MNDKLAKELIEVLNKIEEKLDDINRTLNSNQGDHDMTTLISCVNDSIKKLDDN